MSGTMRVPNVRSANAARQTHSVRVRDMRRLRANRSGSTARIEEGKRHVSREIGEDDERRIPDRRPQHDRVITCRDRVHHQAAHTRPRENTLDEYRASDDAWKGERKQYYHRRKNV